MSLTKKQCELCGAGVEVEEAAYDCPVCGVAGALAPLGWRAHVDIAVTQAVPSALDTQIGGGHYKDMRIQPLEYCHANNIGKIEGDVIAYVSRWKLKGGIEDLKKARHELDILIELEMRDAATRLTTPAGG